MALQIIKFQIFESFRSSHISLQEECSEESKQHKKKKKKHKKVGLSDIGITIDNCQNYRQNYPETINRDNLRHVFVLAHMVARKSHSSIFSLLLWD